MRAAVSTARIRPPDKRGRRPARGGASDRILNSNSKTDDTSSLINSQVRWLQRRDFVRLCIALSRAPVADGAAR